MLVKKVGFKADTVLVEVAPRRRRLVCPECGYSTRARKDTRPENSVWRHLDLGAWRLELHCRRRRLVCPVHGARTEGVPFARPDSEFTRDFESLVAWLATRTDQDDRLGRIPRPVRPRSRPAGLGTPSSQGPARELAPPERGNSA